MKRQWPPAELSEPWRLLTPLLLGVNATTEWAWSGPVELISAA